MSTTPRTIISLAATFAAASCLACPPGEESEVEFSFTSAGAPAQQFVIDLEEMDDDDRKVIVRREAHAVVVGPDGEVHEFEIETDDDDMPGGMHRLHELWEGMPEDIRRSVHEAIEEAMSQLKHEHPQLFEKGRVFLHQMEDEDHDWSSMMPRIGALMGQQRQPLALAPAPTRRAWLGVRMSPAETDDGVATRIESVMEDSPAEAAGLEAGDIIIMIDDAADTDPSQMVEIIGGRRPGDEVEIVVLRNGRRRTIEVELGRPNAETLAVPMPAAPPAAGFNRTRDLAEQLQRQPRSFRWSDDADAGDEDDVMDRLEDRLGEIEDELEERLDEIESRFERMERLMERMLDRLEATQQQRRPRRSGTS